MTAYEELIKTIIKEVAKTVGPVAIMLANQIRGLTASPYKVTIQGDPFMIIKKLLKKYKQIIGPVAMTLAKKSAKPIIEKNKELKNLQNLFKQ